MASVTEPISPSLVNELNLMHYVELLKRRWFWIVACGVLGAAIAFLTVYTTPPSYSARTELAIIRTGTIVNFDPKFRTVSDTDPNAQGLDTVARRQSLLAIGDSPAFTEQVIQKIGNQLPEYLRTPEGLQSVLTVSSNSDVIRVSAETESPELAALITNTWADIYVTRVNEVYGESSLDSASLEAQAETLKKEYDVKQSALLEFIGSTPTDRLLRERDVVARQLNGRVDMEAKLLRLIADATALRELIAGGGTEVTSSQEFSKFMVEANSFMDDNDTPIRVEAPLNADVTPSTRTQALAELDSLLVMFRGRLEDQGGAERDALYKQLSNLDVQIEVEQAKRKDLEAARDLAFGTYQLVNTKVAENTLATETESQLVQIASPAIVPTRPASKQTLLKTVLGGLAGLVVGAALAVVLKPR